MEYAERMLEVYHKIWTFSGIVAVILLVIAVTLLFCFRIPKIIRKWRWILAFLCILTWRGNGSLIVKAEHLSEQKIEDIKPIDEFNKQEEPKELGETGESEPKDPEEAEEPEEIEKPEETKDTVEPRSEFTWKDSQGNELDPEAYYQTEEELVMELVIQEENLDMEATKIYLEALDASGKAWNPLEVQELHGKSFLQLKELAELEERESEIAEQKGHGTYYEFWEEEGVFRLLLHLKTEANYHVSAHIQDIAGNISENSVEDYVDLGSFCLDRTAPSISEKDGITWEAVHQTFLEKLINQITFGYFCQPNLTVKIQAFDSVSGVGGITYICEGIGGEDTLEPFRIARILEPEDGLMYEELESRAYTIFSLPSSFQGTIRAQAWDKAGTLMKDWNETIGILIESKQMHEKNSNAQVFVEENSGGRENFYRGDVQLKFAMEDGFSGIRSIQIQAGNQEEQLTFEEKEQEIQRTVEYTVTIPALENNQNNIPILGSLTDFAGHTTELMESPIIHIDTRAPEVKVEWINQDVRNEKYYQADRTACIVIRERNFVPEQVQLELTGMESGMLSWTHQAGEGCNGASDPRDLNHSDSCTWSTEIIFDKDGEYSFGLSCQDAAGNRGSYEKVDNFIIDKTPPALLVHWDDTEAINDHYYAKERKAVLEIKERNLSSEDLKSFVEAYDRGEVIESPAIGPLRQWEEESWRAGITFEKDGRYQWEIQCTDLAGNKAEVYHSEEFVIDKTPPKLLFENVADCSANRGMIAPKLCVIDTNFDQEQATVNFTGSNGTGEIPAWTKSSEEYGFTILWGDFEKLPENDDLYHIKAQAGDLAGNVSEAELTFSVNRFGSVYELSEDTAKLAGPEGSRYASLEPELIVTEYNPDFLDYYQITSNREGETIELEEGKDYQVEKRGTKDTWKAYQYCIGKENFQKEGIYLVTLYSEDQAKNASNNRVKEKSLEFIVDKTGPSIVVTGVKDRERIPGNRLKLQVDVRDTFALMGAEIYLNGRCVATYDKERLQELEGILTYPVSGAKAWQILAIKAWDQAGNLTETKPIRFLLTEQVRFRFLGDDEPLNIWLAFSMGILILMGLFLAIYKKILKKLCKKISG